MANHVSAQKRARQNPKRRLRNRLHAGAMRSEVKAFRTALEGGDKAAAATALKDAISAVERTKSRGVVKKGTASRTVARLSAAFHKTFGG